MRIRDAEEKQVSEDRVLVCGRLRKNCAAVKKRRGRGKGGIDYKKQYSLSSVTRKRWRERKIQGVLMVLLFRVRF